MTGEPVVLVPYDPDWPRVFEGERAELAVAFGTTRPAIEHIGSTAVPGLDAKPILDILVGIPLLQGAAAQIPALEAIGYRYWPQFEDELPERRYFDKGSPAVHLHVVEYGDGFWRRHLAFRDALRRDPSIVAAYRDLKLRLAARYQHDRQAYTLGKSQFIQDTVDAASAGLVRSEPA